MKRSKFLQLFLGITLFLIFPRASAQTVFEGQIINKTSEAPVPNVNIRLAREKITATSNVQGYFRISSADSVVKDTLIFSSVGYQTFKLLTSAYQKNGFISLVPTTTTLEEVSITNEKLKIVRLNKFDLSDIKEDPPGAKAGPFPVVTYPFSPRNRFFAKLFTAPQEKCGTDQGRSGKKRIRRNEVSGQASDNFSYQNPFFASCPVCRSKDRRTRYVAVQ